MNVQAENKISQGFLIGIFSKQALLWVFHVAQHMAAKP
jgi:hypothetical protein